MYFTCVFRNRPKSMRATQYAENKLKSLVRQFTTKPFRMQLTLEPEGNQQLAQLNLISDKTYSVYVSATGGGIYEAIDNLAIKLRELLRRRKDRGKKGNGQIDKFSLARLDNEIIERQWRFAESDSVDAQEILNYEASRRRHHDGFSASQ